MYVTKIDCDRDFAHFLYTFLCFKVVLTSKDIMVAWQGECLSPILDLGRMSV